MKKKPSISNHKILFIVIAVLAFLLRFYKLGAIPLSLSWDEVSLGYNAYSILETGRDEHGKWFPLSAFEAYGDYKPPAYIYAIVPFIALFDLNEFSTRAPSALAGSITVMLTYVLVGVLFGKEKKSLALLSMVFLAISPWHLNLSRTGFEANLALCFVVTGIILFLKAVRGTPKVLPLSALFFILSLYTFNSCRIFVPLFGLFLAAVFRTQLWHIRKWVGISILVGAITVMPLVPHLLSREGKLRFQEVNIFTDLTPIETANKRIEVDKHAWWASFFHNRRILFAVEIARHYSDNLNMNFLFINGDGNPKFSIRDVGQLYLWDLPFLFAGFYFLIRKKEGLWFLVPVWLLVSIIPASIARETPHALRILNGLPTWHIITAYGFLSVMPPFKRSWKHYVFFSTAGVLLFVNFSFYAYNYYMFYPKEYASEWQWGYREGIQEVVKRQDAYEEVRITEEIGRPYMYVLFYTKYDPMRFWQEVDRTSDPYGFFNVHGFGKYAFGTLVGNPAKNKVLHLYAPKETPASASVLKTIQYPNGKEALILYE